MKVKVKKVFSISKKVWQSDYIQRYAARPSDVWVGDAYLWMSHTRIVRNAINNLNVEFVHNNLIYRQFLRRLYALKPAIVLLALTSYQIRAKIGHYVIFWCFPTPTAGTPGAVVHVLFIGMFDSTPHAKSN